MTHEPWLWWAERQRGYGRLQPEGQPPLPTVPPRPAERQALIVVFFVAIRCPKCKGNRTKQTGRNRHKRTQEYRTCRDCGTRFVAQEVQRE